MINSKRIYWVNQLMNLLPNSGCHSLKSRLFRWAGAIVGENVEIFQGVKVQGIGELELRDRCFIGHETLFLLNEGSKITIEEEGVVSSRCMLISGFHPITPNGVRIISREGTTSQLTVKKGAAILAGSIILPGVTVGKMALVAAGATVTKDVEPFTMVGGCPAREFKKLGTE